MFISGCTKNDCAEIEDLEEAKKLCLDDGDCFGVIEEDGIYQLRRGPGIKESKKENSWIRKFHNCSEVDKEGVFLDVDLLEANYPELKSKKIV